MIILVLGASGATGRLLVEQLLDSGQAVRVIVRSAKSFAGLVKNDPNLSLMEASLMDLSDANLTKQVKDCDAVASCLGHNLTLKGLYGHPRRLVTESTRRLCEAIRSHNPEKPVKYILMNTAGNSNRDLNEKIPLAQKVIILLLRHLLPPHADNEQAADYLRAAIGQNDRSIQWVAVRPDSLIDEPEVSEYELHASPARSALFDAGKTSRINVAHFMSRLITEDNTWERWQGKMPVIYNKPPKNEMSA